MRQRGIIIIVAIFFGLAAAFMVTNYADKAKNRALSKTKKVAVLVADHPLPVGLTRSELRARELVKYKKIPKEFVVDNAVTSKKKLGAKVLAVGLGAGEQLTTDKFKVSKEAGLAFTIPEDMVAVAIPIDDMKAAGNLVKVGDYVNVVGTAKTTGQTETYMTKTILQKVKVLAIGRNLENPDQQSSATKLGAAGDAQTSGQTVTLSLTQADSEKLIFMQDQGHIWLTLLPSKDVKTVSTEGQTLEKVFK